MRRDENGYIVVETIGCFLLFVLLIISILSLINIVVVQARIHFALTQAAESISMYSYVLERTGVAGGIIASAGKADQVESEINTFKDNINGVIEGIQSIDPSQIGASGEAAVDQVGSWVDKTAADPQNTIQLMMNYSLQELGGKAFEELIRPLVGRYLSNGKISGNDYLRTFRVIDGLAGLDFYSFDAFDMGATSNQDSRLLTADADVRIVVRYDIDYSFGALMLPFGERPRLSISQEVRTKAWLNGRGEGYVP